MRSNAQRGQFPQEWDAAQGIDNDDYVREWELPQVREIQADDSMAEAAYGEFPRRFIPFGTGNFLFSLFGTYRTGPKSFAVVGLGPRLLHKFWSKPLFECYWDSNDDTSSASSLEVSAFSLVNSNPLKSMPYSFLNYCSSSVLASWLLFHDRLETETVTRTTEWPIDCKSIAGVTFLADLLKWMDRTIS